jgi:hypothetical protein
MGRPGRPPLDPTAPAPSADVHLTLSAKDYDRAEQIAKQKRESLQDTIRRAIKRLIDDARE